MASDDDSIEMRAMTAEEVALEEFRRAVRRTRQAAAFVRTDPKSYALRAALVTWRDSVHRLARIIRAIRAEREEADGIPAKTWRAMWEGLRKRLEHVTAPSYDARLESRMSGYEEGYEQGRRDALRGVQGACLFEMGRMEERQRKYGGAPWDWERCPEDMRAYDVLCEVAEFAEEAAR